VVLICEAKQKNDGTGRETAMRMSILTLCVIGRCACGAKTQDRATGQNNSQYSISVGGRDSGGTRELEWGLSGPLLLHGLGSSGQEQQNFVGIGGISGVEEPPVYNAQPQPRWAAPLVW